MRVVNSRKSSPASRAASRLISAVFFTISAVSYAGTFDCSVVYDEFDQLMLGQFLVEPDAYVKTLDSLITRTEFLELQTNQFKLQGNRKGSGIGIFRTNQNSSGKMTFTWVEQPAEAAIPLIVDEIIVFERVADGFGPHRLKTAYILPGFGVDLDSGAVLDKGDPAVDMAYELIDGEYVIQAVNPVEIHFPIESMCILTESIEKLPES